MLMTMAMVDLKPKWLTTKVLASTNAMPLVQ